MDCFQDVHGRLNIAHLSDQEIVIHLASGTMSLSIEGEYLRVGTHEELVMLTIRKPHDLKYYPTVVQPVKNKDRITVKDVMIYLMVFSILGTFAVFIITKLMEKL
ncbi:MAG: hypothetical protein IEMM0008_1728 [bacterium]|nr:MAG: hypothetical protein IEMM0008_1728 [bacterium]